MKIKSNMRVPSGVRGFSLRALERTDIAAWYAYLRLPKVIEHTSWNLNAESDLMPFFDSLESDSVDAQIRFAVIDEKNRRLIGTIGFHTISLVNKTAEIAYDLHPEYWGLGIARAICQQVTQWSFAEMNLHRVQATVLPANIASIKVLQACNFQFEGLLRSYRLVRGSRRDYALYARLATDSLERA